MPIYIFSYFCLCARVVRCVLFFSFNRVRSRSIGFPRPSPGFTARFPVRVSDAKPVISLLGFSPGEKSKIRKKPITLFSVPFYFIMITIVIVFSHTCFIYVFAGLQRRARTNNGGPAEKNGEMVTSFSLVRPRPSITVTSSGGVHSTGTRITDVSIP